MKEKSVMRLNAQDQILEYKDTKTATKFGKSAHILLPKKLIGKSISIHYVIPKEKDTHITLSNFKDRNNKKPTEKRVSIRLSDEVHKALKKLKKKGETMEQVLLRVVLEE